MPPRKTGSSLPKQTDDGKRSAKTTSKARQHVKLPSVESDTYQFLVPMIPPPRPLPPRTASKGKGRATEVNTTETHVILDGIWADIYQPSTEQELAVHKRKVEIVRGWLTDAFNVNKQKYRKLLVLTGPAGAGKTATIRVLSRELKFDIIEWQNALDDVFNEEDYESLSRKFQTFMSRASDMRPLSAASSSMSNISRRQVILLEDLPNLLHGPTLETFQSAIAQHIKTSDTPIVLIVSDAGSRGQFKDEEGWSNRQTSVVDVRMILPTPLLHDSATLQVEFNPIANTFMRKAIQGMVDRHFDTSVKLKPSKSLIDSIVESSGGDIRSALMALQFVTIAPSSSKKGVSTSLQVVTKREHALALFHLLGKILYNKRVGDPLSESLSKADQERERKLDKLVFHPPSLPSHLSQFQRAASRVDVEALYSESPVDTSLLSLYIHQNYTQFCEEVEQCEGIMESLSSFDSMGDAWDNRGQVAAEKFYALTMGTLISLPSPVPRQGQKLFKPDYFDHLKEIQKAKDAVEQVHDVLCSQQDIWSTENIRLWLPSILRYKASIDSLQSLSSQHALFSTFHWTGNAPTTATAMDEDDVGTQHFTPTEALPRPKMISKDGKDTLNADDKYWLDEDDITEF